MTCRQDKVEIQVVTTVDGFVWFWANFAIPSLFGSSVISNHKKLFLMHKTTLQTADPCMFDELPNLIVHYLKA
jgi:hypothetical protein